MRVLIVEDEVRIREGIGKLLTRSGGAYEVIREAGDGAEGLKAILELEPDIVITDIRMKDMDGLETLKKLRGSGHNLNAPAIALTANAISGAREMYIEAGFDGYLSKPVESEKLEMLLMNILPQNKIKEQEKDNG